MERCGVVAYATYDNDIVKDIVIHQMNAVLNIPLRVELSGTKCYCAVTLMR